jgi:hypothetical protein
VATFSKTILSGSTDGKAVLVAQTATAGTLVHTGPTNTAHLHEIWLYAVNTSATGVKLTVEWGDATSPASHIELTVAAEAGLTLVAPGLLIKGNATALTVRAFAATANVVTIHGFVNTIS